MIQRIQTLYLLIITILSSILIFNPVAELINKTDALSYIFNAWGIYLIQPTENIFKENVWSFTFICIIIPLLSLITVFLYKKRILQIRITIINLVLMAGFYALMFIYLWFASKNLNADWSLNLVTAFPLINIVLSILSIIAIGKDEALVKSLNRIR